MGWLQSRALLLCIFPSTLPSIWTAGNCQFWTFLTSPKCQFELLVPIARSNLSVYLGLVHFSPVLPLLVWSSLFFEANRKETSVTRSSSYKPRIPVIAEDHDRPELMSANTAPHFHPPALDCGLHMATPPHTLLLSWNILWGPGMVPRFLHTCAI